MPRTGRGRANATFRGAGRSGWQVACTLPGMPRIRGVVLDVDGTLVDSNDAHARAWVDALAEAGYGVPFERVRPLIGMGPDKLLPAAIGRAADGEEAQAIAARRGVIFRQVYLPDVEPFDGARELLEALDRRGFW